jgi:hypothetical protein
LIGKCSKSKFAASKRAAKQISARQGTREDGLRGTAEAVPHAAPGTPKKTANTYPIKPKRPGAFAPGHFKFDGEEI